MEKKELNYSKSRIDKAGIELKRISDVGGALGHEAPLDVLSNWRAYHVISLDAFAKTLKLRSKKINSSSIVAQRLKRTPSILLKLKKHKTMRLSAMQDIGGMRAILPEVKDVYGLLDLYKNSKSKHKLFSLDDYIHKPKRDGYRGIHLVYKIKKDPSLFLELQFRSHLQHIWATGVEVFGTLQGSSFKSGFGEKKWLELFLFLSSVFSLKEGASVCDAHKKLLPKEILSLTKLKIQELKAIETLNAYTSMYKINTNTKLKGREGEYILIALDSRENKVVVDSFSKNDFNKAAKKYLEMEKEYYNNKDINIVLVNSPGVKKLALSYPNYVMDTKLLIRYMSLIALDKFIG